VNGRPLSEDRRPGGTVPGASQPTADRRPQVDDGQALKSNGASALDRAAETLRLLLDADDLEAALEQHAQRLDADFVSLVRLNAGTARADGNAELAEGLEGLAEYAAAVATG
jgi:hypothetical protein